jgi:hypothetical protein
MSAAAAPYGDPPKQLWQITATILHPKAVNRIVYIYAAGVFYFPLILRPSTDLEDPDLAIYHMHFGERHTAKNGNN